MSTSHSSRCSHPSHHSLAPYTLGESKVEKSVVASNVRCPMAAWSSVDGLRRQGTQGRRRQRGSGVLSHASRSRYVDPGRPPAADGGLRSQYPDLVLGAQQPLDCRQLRQAGRRVLTRPFDTRSKASIDLAALAIKPGSSEPQVTTRGRATYTIRFPLTKSQQNVTGWLR